MMHVGNFKNPARIIISALFLWVSTHYIAAQTQGITLLPVQDITFTYSANMEPVKLDLSKYVAPQLPGTGPLTYHVEVSNNIIASLQITGSIATITPTPNAGEVVLKFKVVQGAYGAIGTIKVRVYDYHGLPGLVNPSELPTCYDYMGAVNFTSAIKFMTNYDVDPSSVWPDARRINGSDGAQERLYGFSIPLVADMDGDGYPEIIALGRQDATNDLSANYAYLDIFDGRTGVRQSNVRLRLDLQPSGNALTVANIKGNHGSPGIFTVIDSDRDGKKEVIVALPVDGTMTYKGHVVSYEISKTKPFTMSEKWNFKYVTGTNYAHHPVIQVVDFDGDGRTELLVYNKILDATNGRLKLTMEDFNENAISISPGPTTEAYTGRNTSDLRSWDDQVSFAYVYDVDLDGRYDIVAGGKVYYDIRLTPNGTDDGSCRIIHQTGIGDGRTGVADMNGDGIPDIVVANRTSSSPSEPLRLYIWDPGFLRVERNYVVKNYLPDNEGRNANDATSFNPRIITERSIKLNAPAEGSNSYIYIGDIDGRVQKVGAKEYRLPEVAVIAGHFEYEEKSKYHPNVRDETVGAIPTSGTSSTNDADAYGILGAWTMDMEDSGYLKPSFVLVHKDRSGNTGFTMFDFDNDGIQEICYRDEDNLRIIKANKPYVTRNEPLGNTVIFSKTCYSYTGFEYPAIADVDNDNSADMIVIGKNKGPSAWDAYGYVYVVSNGDGEKFAPAWPVWNQFMYDPFKVTPDSVTTPWGLAPNRLDRKYNFVRQVTKADGTIETISDFNPFNGTLRQATKLDAQAIPKYEPIVFLTEAYIISATADPLKPQIVTSGNEHFIELTIGCKDSARSDISAKTPLVVYKQNIISQATVHRTLTMADLFVKGSTVNKLGSTFSLSPGNDTTVWISIGSGAAAAGELYIVRLGDDSKLINNVWTWRFGYNGGDKYGTAYPCNDFDQGLGTANRAFRDCDWCDQTVRAARYQAIPDLYTLQEFNSIEMDVLQNDILPIVPLPGYPNQCFLDTVRLTSLNIVKPPMAGRLTFNNVKGVGARIIYHHDDRAILPANIDSFQYQLEYWSDVKKDKEITTSTVYIYILKSATGGFSFCFGVPTRIELQNKPYGVNFEWYKKQYGNDKIQADSCIRITGNIESDSIYWLKPIMSKIAIAAGGDLTTAQLRHYRTLNFPRSELKVRLTSNKQGDTTLMKWTGHVDRKWRNPKNWVEVRPGVNGGKPQESPVNFMPSECTDVIIPADVNNFPELIDTAVCNSIKIENRAMLANPHVLKYADASVEIKLKPSERDRFIMWSAPLMDMYSGDYHYRNSSGTAMWGDVFINMFQRVNPDSATFVRDINRFTATFASVDQPLPLGAAFNLKVATTAANRDSFLRFPRAENKYTISTGEIHLTRTANRKKFITHGKNLDASGMFNLPVYGDTIGRKDRLLQVVNPYMAYLSIDSFLKHNSILIQKGYYMWDGEMGTDISAVSFSDGNRITVTNPAPVLKKDIAYIPPLQSFFIAITGSNALTTVRMSPYWTTTSPASYILRTSKIVKSGGTLNISLVKGSQTAHAALVHSIGSSAFMDRDDMPAVGHTVDNQTSLSLYTISPNNEQLAINSNEHFAMIPLPLGLTVKEAGEYRLEFGNLESFGYDIILIDKQAGYKQIDLSKTHEYNFTISKTSPGSTIELNDRFELRLTYTGKGITIADVEPINQSLSLNIAAGRGYIQVSSTAGPIESIEVYDATGRRIYADPVVNSPQLRISIASPPMMYIVKAMIGGELRIRKTIIK